MREPMDLRRAKPHRHAKRAIMIVFSGDLEEDYLHWAKKMLQHTEIPLEVVPDPNTAVGYVRAAIKLRNAARKDGNQYEIWCVVDALEDIEEALVLAVKNKIRVVVSRPSFAAWLLMHFEDVVDIDTDEITRRLAGYLPDVTSRSSAALLPLAGRFVVASERARQGRAGVASSDVCDLIEAIQESLREYLDDDERRAL